MKHAHPDAPGRWPCALACAGAAGRLRVDQARRDAGAGGIAHAGGTAARPRRRRRRPAPAARRSRSVATVDLAKPARRRRRRLAAPSQRIVYFDFDSFVVKDEFSPMLDGHAKALTANRSKRMVVEGHTDERGGREYNLALGQKRAEAVAQVADAAGRQRRAARGGELRRGAPGGAGQRRSGLGAEPPRRTEGPLRCGAAPCRCAPRWRSLALGAGAPARPTRGLFDDDEARKAILDLRDRIAAERRAARRARPSSRQPTRS